MVTDMTNTDGKLNWYVAPFLGTWAVFAGYKIIKLTGFRRVPDAFLIQRLGPDNLPEETLPGLFGSATEALSSVGVCIRCGEAIEPGRHVDPEYVCPKFRC